MAQVRTGLSPMLLGTAQRCLLWLWLCPCSPGSPRKRHQDPRSTLWQWGNWVLDTSSLQVSHPGKGSALHVGSPKLPKPRLFPKYSQLPHPTVPGCLFLQLPGCESLLSPVSVAAFEGIYKPWPSPCACLSRRRIQLRLPPALSSSLDPCVDVQEMRCSLCRH